MLKKIPNSLEKKQKKLGHESDVLSCAAPRGSFIGLARVDLSNTHRYILPKICIMTMKVIMRILLVKLCIPLIRMRTFHIFNKKRYIFQHFNHG